MKHLKTFKIFEEIDVDAGADLKLKSNSKRMEEAAKKYEQLLTKEGIKMMTKNSQSTDDTRKLREEAIKKVKDGDKNAYGIMQWSSDICQSFTIVSPVSGSEVVAAPKFASQMKINGTVSKDCVVLDVYNTTTEATSLYMEADGEVLFQWNEREKSGKGKLANKATQLI